MLGRHLVHDAEEFPLKPLLVELSGPSNHSATSASGGLSRQPHQATASSSRMDAHERHERRSSGQGDGSGGEDSTQRTGSPGRLNRSPPTRPERRKSDGSQYLTASVQDLMNVGSDKFIKNNPPPESENSMSKAERRFGSGRRSAIYGFRVEGAGW